MLGRFFACPYAILFNSVFEGLGWTELRNAHSGHRDGLAGAGITSLASSASLGGEDA